MRWERAQLIGTSPEMQELRDEIARISTSDAKVLITGETGVGKELVARAVHAHSRRASRPFVAMNCAGLPETLLESELFGHVKGSFTDAYRDKVGSLEIADGGTVFLDEVGEMTLRMQGLLLRFLESGELQKVGSDRPGRRVDVRVIAATNRDLSGLIAEGRFREDLFYRLNVIHLVVPPLRDRRADIPVLAEYFLERFGSAARSGGGQASGGNGHAPAGRRLTISPEAMAALVEYRWPGNVRELENVIERIVVNARGDVAELDDLPPEIRSGRGRSARPRRERRRTVEDELYRRLRERRESFWTAVYPLYMSRDITRETVREIVRRGLLEARGNYRIVAGLFNIEAGDYKRFLNFLRKHQCQLPFKEYRH
ncbi:MAG TPA: sigma-54 dependent transcriptional regulator [Vicinamibacterales bacterium]|nr:sigma-54 dependent transcriptional regulator [Vicinamibacterales bacterium]